MITVNGQEISLADYPEGLTMADYLEEKKYQIARVAVELNGAILSKGSYGSIRLKDGDTIEVVSFVGGG